MELQQYMVAVGWTRSLLLMAVRDPNEREHIIRRAGGTPEAFDHPENRISAETDTAVWKELVDSGRGGIGVRFAEHGVTPSSLGLLGFLTMSARTIGDAMGLGVRYHGLIEDAETTIVRAAPDCTTIIYAPEVGPELPEIVESCLATYVSLGREWSGESDVRPKRVMFKHHRPAHAEELHRFFGCPIVFGSPHNTIEFGTDMLEIKLRHANQELCSYLEGMAQRRLGKLTEPLGVPTRVRKALDESFVDSPPDIGSIARRLGVSVRTLQRRLREHGLAYQQLVDEVRFRRALELLDESSLSIGQISDQLGFSEPRGFRRAFRRWSGLSPASYRARRHSPSPEPPPEPSVEPAG